MAARAPAFWWRPEATWQARLLGPVGSIYGAVSQRRMARPGVRLVVPVLCIGNFTVGGAGKTPTAIEIVARLKARGHRPAFLSRGYGRTHPSAAVLAVDPARHRVEETGDEPLLLARHAPTFVAGDRVAAAKAAIAAGASILIMDDGFQNPALVKSASIVVVDGATGIGNGHCLPAGPLRAPMAAQWPKVSLLCVIGDGDAGYRLAQEAKRLGVPVARARIEAESDAQHRLGGRRLFAFSGIGRPEKFFATLDALGLDVIERRTFADHHLFTADERRKLLKDAHLSDAELVTTQKDRVRLPADFDTHVLPVRLVFEVDQAIDGLLDQIAGKAFNGG